MCSCTLDFLRLTNVLCNDASSTRSQNLYLSKPFVGCISSVHVHVHVCVRVVFLILTCFISENEYSQLCLVTGIFYNGFTFMVLLFYFFKHFTCGCLHMENMDKDAYRTKHVFVYRKNKVFLQRLKLSSVRT